MAEHPAPYPVSNPLVDKKLYHKSVSSLLSLSDCSHAYVSGHHSSGMYYIKIDYSACPIPVYCDMDCTKGGWTVILRRQDGSVSFQRNWEEYQNGFGNLSGEFWIGNDNIFLMTHQDRYILRIDMWDFEGVHKYAEYSKFWIDGRNEDYRLHLGEYSGNAGNSLNFHNNSKFSTRDNDNDAKPKDSCAITLSGGWWFFKCYMGFLTGKYVDYPVSDENAGIIWLEWKVESLKKAEMKIRHRHSG